MVRDVRAEGHCGRKLSNPVHSDAEKLLQIYEFIIQNTSLEERLERKYLCTHSHPPTRSRNARLGFSWGGEMRSKWQWEGLLESGSWGGQGVHPGQVQPQPLQDERLPETGKAYHAA
jgi:hypothetical protein